MRTIVFADRRGAELAPLTDRRPVALLPFAGRPLVEHTLIALAEQGIHSATIVAGPYVEALQEQLGEGTRFGISLQIVTRAPRFAASGHEPVLLLRGDMLRHPEMIEEALAGAAGSPPPPRQIAAGVVLAIERTACDQPVAFDRVVQMQSRLNAPGPWSVLSSLREFHEAALNAIDGAYGLQLPGQRTADDLLAGRGARIDAAKKTGHTIYVGAFANIHRRATLGDQIVIGDRAMIDEGTRVNRAVVMPGTYVGAGLDLRDAIVDGSTLIRVDAGIVARISDPAILAEC